MSKYTTKKVIGNKSSKSSQSQALATGELRIIGGKWRSRKLQFPAVEGLRPTSSRIRETLFSWLMPILPGANCLDLFSGSGALGFESLSRGAKTVTMVEQNQQVARQLTVNKNLLAAQGVTILNQDANNLTLLDEPFDIIFCDPPFNQGFIQSLITSLQQSSLLTENTKLYIETEKSLTDLTIPDHWTLIKEKTAGDVRYRLINASKY